jgi:hypothetical protein
MSASPERCFELCSDFANAPARIPAIVRVEVLTPGPVGLGTKFKETRLMMKRETTETFEVTAFEPSKRFEMRAFSCGVDFGCEFHFEPIPEGTNVTVTMTSAPKSFFAKLMSPLGFLMMGTMKKCIDDDLACIKAAAEAT